MDDSDWVMTYGNTDNDNAPSIINWELMMKFWTPIELYPPECEITGHVKVIGEL